MKYTLYILENTEHNYYIGQTANIEERLKRHNDNRVISTKYRGPWKIVYTETYPTRGKAMVREKQLKKWRRDLLNNLIDGD